jgi:hypothetical protein
MALHYVTYPFGSIHQMILQSIALLLGLLIFKLFKEQMVKVGAGKKEEPSYRYS